MGFGGQFGHKADFRLTIAIEKKVSLWLTLSFEIGGAEGARTPDLMTASHALSQLSYSPKQLRSK